MDGDDSSHSLLLHNSSQTKTEEKTPTDMEPNDLRGQQQDHRGLSGLGSRLKKNTGCTSISHKRSRSQETIFKVWRPWNRSEYETK